MFALLFPFVLLIIQSHCQGMGNGISKHTWAASDPIACSDWFTTYLPATIEYHPGCYDVNHCPCATQGRVHTDIPSGGIGFGLHAINCTYHPYGALSVKDIEDKFQAKFGDLSTYDAFMDYNMGLWANNLDPFVTHFQRDEIPFMALKWMSDGDQYYSILANPCGHILIELMSDTVHVLDTEMMIESYPRMTFRDWNSPVQTGDYITPVRVSRAISTEGLVDPFYRDILGSRQIYKETFADGVTVHEIIPPGSKVHIQLWSGHPTSEDWTIADYENYVNSVHDDIMINGLCGFDQWIDNHIAIDSFGTPTLDEVAERFETEGYYYHWWKVGPMYQIYAADNSGWGLQLDFPGGSTAPPNVPTYAATCASEDGCLGQGHCKAQFYEMLKDY